MNRIKKQLAVSTCYLVVMAISLLTHSCNEAVKTDLKKDNHNNADTSSTELEIYIDLPKVLEKKNDAEALTVPVKYDHYFKSPKKYKGYYINTIIDSVVKSKN